MSAEDIISIINAIPKYITYIYPGYITIYVYTFLRAKHIHDTRSVILKSIALSYIYLMFAGKISWASELFETFLLIGISVLVAYLAYIASKSEYVQNVLKTLGIQTTFWDNEIEALQGFQDGAWLVVYSENGDAVYEGSLHLKELEPGQRQYISLTKYRKYMIGQDGRPVEPYISDYESDEEEVIIFYENIKLIEKREVD